MQMFKDKKSIIFISHDAMYFGAQINSLYIIKKLREQHGFDVHTVLLNGGELYKKFKRYSKSIICLNDSNSDLISWLNKTGSNTAICNTVLSGKIIPELSINGISCISLIHEMSDIIKRYKAIDCLKNISKYSKKIIFASTFVYKDVNRLITLPRDRIEIRPQGLYFSIDNVRGSAKSKKWLNNKFNIDSSKRIVLGMGYGDKRKGVDLFAEVCKNVVSDNNDCVFVWAGQVEHTWKEKLNNYIKDNSLENKLIFAGPTKKPIKYFLGSDLFLLTSREDPFPTVVLEAFDSGLPVICFNNGGGYIDIIKDINGVKVPMENTSEMSKSVTYVLNNLFKYDRLAIHEWVHDRFSFDNYVAFLVEVVKQVQDGNFEK